MSKNYNIFLVVLIPFILFGYEVFSFFSDWFDFEPRYISIPIRIFIGILSLIIFAKEKARNFNKSLYVVLLFWIFYLIKFTYEAAIHPYILDMKVDDYWGYIFLGCLLPMLGALSYISPRTLDKAFLVTFIFLILTNVFGIINNQKFIISTENDIRADANASLNTISFAASAASLITLSLFKINDKKYFIFSVLGIILGIINVGIAGSRGPIIQMVLVGLIYLVLYRNKIKLKYVVPISAILIFTINYLVQKTSVFEVIINRFTKSQFDKGGSDFERQELMNNAYKQFLENPIFGKSVEVLGLGNYPHNMLLESFMTLGVLGGIICMVILILSFRKSLTMLTLKHYDWLTVLFLYSFIATFTTGSIANNWKFWFLLIILLNFNYNNYVKNEQDSNTY